MSSFVIGWSESLTKLLLMRHARAEFPPPGTRDFDRPLAQSGIDDAAEIARAMQATHLIPDTVLVSSAKRTVQTLQCVNEILGVNDDRIGFDDELYSSDAGRYVELISDVSDAQTLLLIGHNPMMEDVAFALTDTSDDAALQKLNRGFPPAGLAVIEFDGPLAELEDVKKRLSSMIVPGQG